MEYIERTLDLPDLKGKEPFSTLTMKAPSTNPEKPFRYSIEINAAFMTDLSFNGKFPEFWKDLEVLVLKDIEENPE